MPPESRAPSNQGFTVKWTIHGRPLLRPGPEANERILGVLGRAAEYYHVRVFAFGVASNHYHLLYFAELSPEAYREMVAEVVSEIEEEAAAERGDRPVLGVEKILSQDACQRPRQTKQSPAPMLFFAKSKHVREARVNSYRDFVDKYELAADRLAQAALQGYRLDPARHFPTGSFPPAVIEELLKAADGFNPEREFPKGSFPRPWPFVGGGLRPAPPTPPTRLLTYKGPDDPTIVRRGEIPTARVPRSDCLEDGAGASGDPAMSRESPAQPSRRLARDPP